MHTTLQPPGHAALQSLPVPRDALMQADAPLMAYLAQRFACWLPASGTSPSNRALAGCQAIDGSPLPRGGTARSDGEKTTRRPPTRRKAPARPQPGR
jgi:hypothetical protein